jgi:hypothetical protein
MLRYNMPEAAASETPKVMEKVLNILKRELRAKRMKKTSKA